MSIRDLAVDLRGLTEQAKKPKLGGGGRFKALVSKLKKKKGKTRTGKSRDVTDEPALAAWIGRKKYGKKKFQQMAAAGRKRKG